MATRCAHCGTPVTRKDDNFGEFWYGIADASRGYMNFSVCFHEQRISILGHQRLYFCSECLNVARFSTELDIIPTPMLDRMAIDSSRAALGGDYHYFSRRDFAHMTF